jgi:hypothetical protein
MATAPHDRENDVSPTPQPGPAISQDRMNRQPSFPPDFDRSAIVPFRLARSAAGATLDGLKENEAEDDVGVPDDGALHLSSPVGVVNDHSLGETSFSDGEEIRAVQGGTTGAVQVVDVTTLRGTLFLAADSWKKAAVPPNEEEDDYADVKAAIHFCANWLPLATLVLCPVLAPVASVLSYALNSSPKEQVNSAVVEGVKEIAGRLGVLMGLPDVAGVTPFDDLLFSAAGTRIAEDVLMRDESPVRHKSVLAPAIERHTEHHIPPLADERPLEERTAYTQSPKSNEATAPGQSLDEFIARIETMALRYSRNSASPG